MHTIDRWAVNESLLQSYRSIFISSQSFLLAIGAILTGKSFFLLLIVAAVGVVVTWTIWFPVVTARHRIVDYYKYLANLDSDTQTKICPEGDYISDPKLRAEANELLGLQTHWRVTRVKIDFGLPTLFTIVWVALLIHDWTQLP
jgi:hypothetical protein